MRGLRRGWNLTRRRRGRTDSVGGAELELGVPGAEGSGAFEEVNGAGVVGGGGEAEGGRPAGIRDEIGGAVAE